MYYIGRMNRKPYNQLGIIILLFLAALTAVAGFRNHHLPIILGLLTVLVFLMSTRPRAKLMVDEREESIQEKAARSTYAIFVPMFGVTAILLLLPSSGLFTVFARGEFAYLEAIGMIFAYLTLFLLAIYAISYYFINRKYGGNDDQEQA